MQLRRAATCGDLLARSAEELARVASVTRQETALTSSRRVVGLSPVDPDRNGRFKLNPLEEWFMFKKALGAVILALTLIATPMGSVLAAALPPILGVWTCTVVRAGNVQRPLMYTFNSDGTFNYSSATTINSTVAGPVQNSGFHSRGGARGQWTKIGTNVFNYQSVEFLYDANGNLAGSFAVDADLLMTPAGQLCSGTTVCPSQTTSVSLVQYQFNGLDGVDGNITGLNYLLGPGAPANVLCNALSSGQGFPNLPVPMP